MYKIVHNLSYHMPCLWKLVSCNQLSLLWGTTLYHRIMLVTNSVFHIYIYIHVCIPLYAYMTYYDMSCSFLAGCSLNSANSSRVHVSRSLTSFSGSLGLQELNAAKNPSKISMKSQRIKTFPLWNLDLSFPTSCQGKLAVLCQVVPPIVLLAYKLPLTSVNYCDVSTIKSSLLEFQTNLGDLHHL